MNEPEAAAALPAETLRAKMIILALTGVVFLGVVVVIYFLPHGASPGGPSLLATLNAVLNASATVCLLFGYFFIKRKNVVWHRRSMLSAFGLSSMFLLTYLLHHARVGSVPFAGQGFVRTVYFALLLPHILLAAGVVPMALSTIYRAWTGKIETHRSIARITLPIWLYVSVSGVLLYFMLYGN